MKNLLECLFPNINKSQKTPPPLTPNQILFEDLAREVQADAKTKGKEISPKAAICGARIRIQDWLND